MKPGKTSYGKPQRDSSHRRRVPGALPRDHENLLSCVIDTVPAVIYSADGGTGDMLLLEGAVEQLCGYTRQALLRDSGLTGRVVHPEDRERVLATYQQGLDARQPFELEFRVLHARDKSVIWVHSRVIPVTGADGALLRHDGVVVDITARRRMESILEARVAERTAELKTINEVLQRSEERFRLLFTNAADALVLHDQSGRILDVNQRGCDLSGYGREEFLSLSVFDLENGSSPEALMTMWRSLLPGAPVALEGCWRLKNGSAIPLEIRIGVLTGESQPCILAAIRDVSDRKRVEEALRESEQRYRTLAESAQDSIFIIDREDRVTYVNPCGARLFNSRPEDLVGRRRSELFPPHVSEHQGRNLERVFETGEPLTAEEMTSFMGRELWLHTHLVPLRDKHGTVQSVMGVSRNVTDRIQAERALRESEERYRTLVENLPVGVFRVIDPEGETVLHVNPAFARMHQFDSVEEIVQVPPVSLYRNPADRKRLFAELERTGSVCGWEFNKICKDGTPLVVSVTAYAHFDANGRMDHVDGIIEDITDRKRAEEQRERLNRAIENAGEGIGTWDARWRLTYVNMALAGIFGGRRPDDVVGREWPSLFAEAEAPKHRAIMLALRTEGRWQGRLLGLRLDGESVPLAVTLARLGPAEGDFLVVANIRDRGTEESHLARIRKLTTERNQSIEQERARISRELHDELGQLLTALNMNLAWMAHSLKADPSVAERLSETQGMVNQTLEAVRRLSTSLRPPILDNQGLLDAIRSHAAEFSQWSGVGCRVMAFPSDLEIGDPLATIAFRVVQEALTNVARHSKATRCDVSLRLIDAILEVKVRDNGVGAVPDDLEGVQSLGIAGMRERAAAVNGTLRVENVPRSGVCVTARLPWPKDQTRDDE